MLFNRSLPAPTRWLSSLLWTVLTYSMWTTTNN
jgi:hypothetical protein